MDPADVLPGHELVAVLRPGRSFLLRSRIAGDRAVLRRLTLDARAALRRARDLRRAGVLVEVLARGGDVWAVRPHVEGTSLEAALRDGVTGAARVREVAGAVAAAVAALHARGIAHGALHPRNVVLRPDGTAALLDALEPSRPAEADAVTAAFLAPERVRGAPASRAADVFALGALLHAAAGEVPFGADEPLEVLRRVLHDRATPLWLVRPELGVEACDAVDRALSAPAWRRPSAEEVRAAVGPSTSTSVAGAGPGLRLRPRLRPRLRLRLRLGPGPILSPDRAPARLRPTRDAVVAAACAAIAIAVLAAADSSLPRFVADARRLLDAGEAARARAVVERAARARPGDGWVDLARGDLACDGGEAAECARRYRAALAAHPGVGSDRRLRANVLRLLERDDRLAVRLAVQLPGIDAALVELTRSDRPGARWSAVRALEARDEADRIDYADVYARDLEQGSCATRRAAAARLAELRDVRVLPRLEAAARREGGLLGLFCAAGAVERALDATRAAAR